MSIQNVKNETNNLRLFEITVKAGHGDQGRKGQGYFIPITFAIAAVDGKAAAEIARWMPRVKHHDRFAVLSLKEIDQERFDEIIKDNDADLFLKVTSKQEQRLLIGDLSDRVVWEDEPKQYNRKEAYTGKTKFYKKSEIKNPKRFAKYSREDYIFDEYEVS